MSRLDEFCERRDVTDEERALIAPLFKAGWPEPEVLANLDRIRAYVEAQVDLAIGDKDAPANEGGALPSKVEPAPVSARERERAAILAARLLHRAADEHPFRYWRLFAPGAGIRRRRAGTDRLGRWEDVEVRLPAVPGDPKPPVRRLRLRADPVALEVRPPAEGRAAPGSHLASLLRDAREVALPAGWSEAEAVRALLTRRPPKPAPLTIRKTGPVMLGGRPMPGTESLTVMVQVGAVSRASVARALARAGRRGRPVKSSTAALLTFVERLKAENGGTIPRWPEVERAWNREKPEGWRRFKSPDDMRRTYTRALERESRRSR